MKKHPAETLLDSAERHIERALCFLPQTEHDLFHLCEALAHIAEAKIQIREQYKK